MMFLFIVPAFLALLLARTWFLAFFPIAWGVRLTHRQRSGRYLGQPLVQLGLAWLLIAAPTVWPGRELPPSLLVAWIPAYGCLDLLLIATGFVWFAVSFLRAWGHRPGKPAAEGTPSPAADGAGGKIVPGPNPDPP